MEIAGAKPSIITNFAVDSFNKTAELSFIGSEGTTFFKFLNDGFLLEEGDGGSMGAALAVDLVIDIMRWFLIIIEDIGFETFGTQSDATLESQRLVNGDIGFERIIGGEKAFEGTYDVSADLLTTEPRSEFSLNSADFAALVMFYVGGAKKIGVPKSMLSTILLLEARIRAFIPFPVLV